MAGVTVSGVVYVTRKFPPSIGGMQTLAAEVWRGLRGDGGARLIALGRSQRHLVWFLPWALMRFAALAFTGRTRHVVFGDPVVAVALSPVVLLARRLDTSVIVHGLDLTYGNPVYRWAAFRVLRRANRIIAISAATGRVAAEAGIPEDRIVVVNPGLDIPAVESEERRRARSALRADLGVADDAFLAVTVGRLVPRKGVAWFVDEVMPSLPPVVHYVVVGDGPDAERIRETVRARGLSSRVHLLGSVTDDRRFEAVVGADLFVMPNIVVPGDMEGFGLVAAEAAMLGTPVLAARLEGIEDATAGGATASLCPPGDAEAFVQAIAGFVARRNELQAQARVFEAEARARFSTERLAADLRALLASSG